MTEGLITDAAGRPLPQQETVSPYCLYHRLTALGCGRLTCKWADLMPPAAVVCNF